MRARANIRLVPLAAAFALAGCMGGDDDPGPARAKAAPSAPADFGVTTVRSRPDLRPPQVLVDRAARTAGERFMFLSPRMENAERDARTHQQGALMLDERGRTVWWRPAADGRPVTDFRVQRYRGEPVLTWWQGTASMFGIGQGEGVIVDRSYDVVATVRAGNRFAFDLHEFLLTPRGTALITIYSRARRDLTELGGRRDAQVTEGIVQEIDVESGRVLFEWHSLEEIEPSESYRELPEDLSQSYDYFHINSVAEDEDGDLLISARHTHAVYKVDRDTGELVWRLGGKKSDFRMGRGADIGLQHDARFLGRDLVQIFDNAAEDEEDQTPSSVKVLRLDEEAMTAELVSRRRQPDREWAESQGNAQTLDDGGLMVGWGSLGAISRFDERGRLLFHAHIPPQYDAYRAYLADWTGRPATKPAIQAKREKGQVIVWASWNGATEIAAWQLLAGPSADRLEPAGGTTGWGGLETALVRSSAEPFFAVAALDAAGKTLATSDPVRLGEPPPEP